MVWAVTPLGQHSPGSRDLTPCPHPEEQDDHGPHIRIWQYLDAVHGGIQYDRKIRTVRNKTNVSSFLDLGLMMDQDRPASEQPPRPHQLYVGYTGYLHEIKCKTLFIPSKALYLKWNL